MPVAFTLQVNFSPPTPAPAGDACANPIVLTPGTPAMVSGADMQNDYALSCSRSGVDAVFRFDLTERRDVMIDVTALSGGGFFSVAVRSAGCVDGSTERTCQSALAPRVNLLGLDPGSYYVVVKASRPVDFSVRLTTYAPITVVNVSGNDTCANAYAIPPGRGYFRGDTTSLHGDYNSPCIASSGKDAVFTLHLASRQRLTVETDTTFVHAVWVSQNDRCPGSAPPVVGLTCTLGNHTMLDAVLDTGDYYIFVDGLGSTDAGMYGMLVNLSPAM
jgi:hypothetical protein